MNVTLAASYWLVARVHAGECYVMYFATYCIYPHQQLYYDAQFIIHIMTATNKQILGKVVSWLQQQHCAE